MHLVLQVVFDYTIGNGFYDKSGTFTGITELRKAVKQNCKDAHAPLTVARTVQIVDTDKQVKTSPFMFMRVPQYKTVKFGEETLTIFIVKKIMYPSDVRKILTKKYGSTLDFDTGKKHDENQPICDFYVLEDKRYGLRDSNPTANHLSDSFIGNPTMYTLRSVRCRYAEPDDICVDKNLKQVWPENENKGNPPVVLTNFLKRRKEKIYEA